MLCVIYLVNRLQLKTVLPNIKDYLRLNIKDLVNRLQLKTVLPNIKDYLRLNIKDFECLFELFDHSSYSKNFRIIIYFFLLALLSKVF